MTGAFQSNAFQNDAFQVGAVVPSVSVATGGGSSITFEEFLARHPWLRDLEIRPNWYLYPEQKKRVQKEIAAVTKKRAAIQKKIEASKPKTDYVKLAEMLQELQSRLSNLTAIYALGMAAVEREEEEEEEFMSLMSEVLMTH